MSRIYFGIGQGRIPNVNVDVFQVSWTFSARKLKYILYWTSALFNVNTNTHSHAHTYSYTYTQRKLKKNTIAVENRFSHSYTAQSSRNCTLTAMCVCDRHTVLIIQLHAKPWLPISIWKQIDFVFCIQNGIINKIE